MSGYQPQGYDPRQRPPETPPQWQQGREPQYPYQQPPPGYWPQQQPPAPPQRRRKSRKGLAFLGCGGLGALVVLIAVVAAASSPSSSSSPSVAATQAQSSAPAQPTAKAAGPAKQTVTYVVTGSAADVTYGPAGTQLNGTVPMRVGKPLGTPAYYSIDAQLQGGGTVSCKILVDGKTVSSATASGGYNIASCEISQDPFSGNWQDDNNS